MSLTKHYFKVYFQKWLLDYKLLFYYNKDISDDMLSTGDIQTIDYCLEVYRQYNTGEALNSFLRNAWEIERTLSLL